MKNHKFHKAKDPLNYFDVPKANLTIISSQRLQNAGMQSHTFIVADFAVYSGPPACDIISSLPIQHRLYLPLILMHPFDTTHPRFLLKFLSLARSRKMYYHFSLRFDYVVEFTGFGELAGGISVYSAFYSHHLDF